MKNVLLIGPFWMIFIACSTLPSEKRVNIGNDTLSFNNGYKIIIDEKRELRRVIKPEDRDTLIISFYSKNFNIFIDNADEHKKYYFSNQSGLYKFKQSILTKEVKPYQNQIVFFDTVSSTFLIKERSDYVEIMGLKDTVLLDQKLKINVRLYDSVFHKFQMCIQPPESDFSFEAECLKNKNFFNNVGFQDEIQFTKKGVYNYQGYIENYMNLEDTVKASRFYFFRKKIFVK
jgi:hypothetical protein